MDVTPLHIGAVYSRPDLIRLQETLEGCGLKVVEVDFGKTIVEGIETDLDFETIHDGLEREGFVFINDNGQWLTELVKIAVHKRLGYTQTEKEDHLNFSDIIARELKKDYRYLSTVFSQQEGITIEKYIIEARVQMASKMLRCKGLTLNDIAHRLEYSSVSYFSSQFKKLTGHSPSNFRKKLHELENFKGQCQLAN